MHILWFRQDLRIQDNPALTQACALGHVLPIYILDETHAGEFSMGGASKVWLHHALKNLNKSLDGQLYLFHGNANEILGNLCQNNPIQSVLWNRCYEPWRIKRDQGIKHYLTELGIEAQSFNGSLLWEPWDVTKADGTPYKVFTPFYRKGCLNAKPPRTPANIDIHSIKFAKPKCTSLTLEQLNLLPERPWGQSITEHWDISEAGAHDRLEVFLNQEVGNYKQGRNFPAKSHVSRLSPYLHFGQISPQQIWHASLKFEPSNDLDHFQSELGWREFSYALLYNFPKLPRENLQAKFDNFPWQYDSRLLQAWQTGQTGYPIVDAGMRELWQTGYMHNRVRMIAGSFLVKNLRLHWHLGERWFWDCLFDADLANNSASWQWIAGCGADAAPYFRIFNPITQGEKHDASGEYTRRFVPELGKLSDKYLFKPWQAPAEVLKAAGIELGRDYPHPICDLKTSREDALKAFAAIKETAIN